MSYSYYGQLPGVKKRYKDKTGRSLMNKTAHELPLAPRNPYYDGVAPVVRSGNTMKVDQISFTRVKKDTTFGNIRPHHLARLLASVLEPVSEHDDEDETGSQDLSGFLDRSDDFSATPKKTSDAEFDSLMDEAFMRRLTEMGMDVSSLVQRMSANADTGEPVQPVTEKALAAHNAPSECFFVLVDVRESDEYEKCHILGSINFPASYLARSMGYLTPEIESVKSREDKVIILYAVEEKRSINTAHILFEKGYDNVMVLSGGMKAFVTQVPREFLSAPPPPEALERVARAGRGGGRAGSVQSFRTVGTRRSTVTTTSTTSRASVTRGRGRGKLRGTPVGGSRVQHHPTETLVLKHLREMTVMEEPLPVPEKPKRHVPKVMGRGRGGVRAGPPRNRLPYPSAGTALERAIQAEKDKRMKK